MKDMKAQQNVTGNSGWKLLPFEVFPDVCFSAFQVWRI